MRRKDERLAACLTKRHRDLAASVKIEMMEKLINYGELGGGGLFTVALPALCRYHLVKQRCAPNGFLLHVTGLLCRGVLQ